MPQGQIVKALSGYYYVQPILRENSVVVEAATNSQQFVATEQVLQCRARGVFKNKGIHPLVGDRVEYEPTEGKEGWITHILERKNYLMRPPIANVDQVLLLFSMVEPNFNPVLLDKFLVHIERANIVPVICLSKTDLAPAVEQNPVTKVYQELGYSFMSCNVKDGAGLEQVREVLAGKITVFAGQSGVGKSSLLNALNSSLALETAAISQKLGRGKHTTRHVELLSLPGGGLVADTPGFSQLDFSDMEPEDLGDTFIEFRSYVDQCKFRGCVHQNEPQCAVKTAVAEGDISKQRYQSYIQLLEELILEKQRKRY